eukprot:513834_1
MAQQSRDILVKNQFNGLLIIKVDFQQRILTKDVWDQTLKAATKVTGTATSSSGSSGGGSYEQKSDKSWKHIQEWNYGPFKQVGFSVIGAGKSQVFGVDGAISYITNVDKDGKLEHNAWNTRGTTFIYNGHLSEGKQAKNPSLNARFYVRNIHNNYWVGNDSKTMNVTKNKSGGAQFIVEQSGGQFSIRCYGTGRYLCSANEGHVTCNRKKVGNWEKFEFQPNPQNDGSWLIIGNRDNKSIYENNGYVHHKNSGSTSYWYFEQ